VNQSLLHIRTNKIPRDLIPQEKIFHRGDQTKVHTNLISTSSDYDEVNVGTSGIPRKIDICKACQSNGKK
jgi:hypothetical protein